MHMPDSDKCNWLRARIETAERQEYSHEEKLRILDRCGRAGIKSIALHCVALGWQEPGQEGKLCMLGRWCLMAV